MDSEDDFRKKMDDYLASLPSGNPQQTNDLVHKRENPRVIDVPPDDCTDSAQIN